MRWFVASATRSGSDSVAGSTEDGLHGSALAEALAVVACTFDFSHPIAPDRRPVAEIEQLARSNRRIHAHGRQAAIQTIAG